MASAGTPPTHGAILPAGSSVLRSRERPEPTHQPLLLTPRSNWDDGVVAREADGAHRPDVEHGDMLGIDDAVPLTASDQAETPAQVAKKKRRHAIGVALIGGVVLLWVGSSALLQHILDDYDRPFFVTYLNTSMFTVYLLTDWVRKRYSKAKRNQIELTAHQILKEDASSHDSEGSIPEPEEEKRAVSPSSMFPVESEASTDSETRSVTSHREGSESELLPKSEHRRIGFILCLLWFALNYLFNLALSKTSLASNTVLSTTSGLFVLIFTKIFACCCTSNGSMDPNIEFASGRPDSAGSLAQAPAQPRPCSRTFTITRRDLINFIGASLTIAGATLVAFRDSLSHSNSNGKDNKGPKHSVLGDLLSVASSAFYGLYSLTLGHFAGPNDDRLDVMVLFGYIGLWNVVVLWPVLIILHFTGVERFVAPSGSTFGFILLNGVFGTVVSDLMWAQAVIYTTPFIATVGLSLTIPIAMIVEYLFKNERFSVAYFVGALIVIVGFVLVNWKYEADLAPKTAAQTPQHTSSEDESFEDEAAAVSPITGLQEESKDASSIL